MIFTGDNKEITRIMTGDGKEIIEVRDGQGRIIYQTAVDMLGDSPLLFQGKGKPLSQYKIWGNSYQNGVPDPDHPVEVQSVGERTNNFFDKAHFTFSDSTTIVYVPIYVGEGSFTLSTDLPVSASGTRDVFFIGGNVSSGANSVTNGVDAATPRTRNSVDGYITVATRYNTIRENPADYHYMLNAGSEALPYEGYYKIPVTVSDGTSSQTANIYLDEPLRRIGDYADEIDFNILNKIIVQQTLDANATVTYRGNGVFWITAKTKPGWRNGVKTVLSTHYSGQANNSPDSSINNNCIMALNYGSIIRIRDYRFESESDFKQFLSDQYDAGTPVTIYYVIDAPTTEPITLPQILTLNGANTLSIDATLLPSQLSITGHIKPSSSYGNLTDVNGTYIKDKDGVQIKVTG